MTKQEARLKGGFASGAVARQRSLTLYYLDPKKCKLCGKVIKVRPGEIASKVRIKDFCNSSCSARRQGFNSRSHSEEAKKKIGASIRKKLGLSEAGYSKDCIICGAKYFSHRNISPRTCGIFSCVVALRKRTMQERGTKVGTGGARIGSGRGKCGHYLGYFVQSTWECAYLIWALAQGKKVERNWKKFSYEFNRKKTYFTPDFNVDGELVEVKGYPSAKTDAKIKKFWKIVLFLTELELEPIFDFVRKRTGLKIEDLWKLYDEHKAIVSVA